MRSFSAEVLGYGASTPPNQGEKRAAASQHQEKTESPNPRSGRNYAASACASLLVRTILAKASLGILEDSPVFGWWAGTHLKDPLGSFARRRFESNRQHSCLYITGYRP